MTLDQRLAPALTVAPEIASMNMGSFNFNISAAAEKRTEWRYSWEKPYLEASKDLILSNTFTQIERGMRELARWALASNSNATMWVICTIWRTSPIEAW